MDKFINKFNQHTKRLINEEEIKLQLFDENGKILLIPFKKIPGPRGELMLEVFKKKKWVKNLKLYYFLRKIN